ncbi:hypothetical protein SAMCCGM7_pB0378 (plasmid) [Sinorhizobium americanum CCGM7]|nr:hypothetical protein SAMCCGM7_pB0378 [Sinorhizobium americanum CCGM7]
MSQMTRPGIEGIYPLFSTVHPRFFGGLRHEGHSGRTFPFPAVHL